MVRSLVIAKRPVPLRFDEWFVQVVLGFLPANLPVYRTPFPGGIGCEGVFSNQWAGLLEDKCQYHHLAACRLPATHTNTPALRGRANQ